MNLYQYISIIISLSFSLQIHCFWNKVVDTISSKINSNTEIVIHKEFACADKIELCNEQGTIIVNSWKQKSIAVEVIICTTEMYQKNIKIDMELIDGIVKIHTIFIDPKIKGSVTFNILLPSTIPVDMITRQGDIIIKDIDAQIHAVTLSGDIKLVNPHYDIVAKSSMGNIFIRTDHIEPAKNIELTCDKGNIEIYTTENMNCGITLSALHGKVISELPIKLDSITTTLNQVAWNRFKQCVHGAIGLPQSQVQCTTHNGLITILPYMKQNDIF